MKKSLSPLFVIVVIVIALALGALYFMVRYRTKEAQWVAESQAVQAQRDRAMRSGRRGMMRMRARGSQTRSGDSARPGGAQPSSEPESQPEAP